MRVLSDEWRVARKSHVCNYCGHGIDPGERYNYTTHVGDGSIYAWKAHRWCQDFVFGQNGFANRGWDEEGVTKDDFREVLWNWRDDLVCDLLNLPPGDPEVRSLLKEMDRVPRTTRG